MVNTIKEGCLKIGEIASEALGEQVDGVAVLKEFIADPMLSSLFTSSKEAIEVVSDNLDLWIGLTNLGKCGAEDAESVRALASEALGEEVTLRVLFFELVHDMGHRDLLNQKESVLECMIDYIAEWVGYRRSRDGISEDPNHS